MAIPVDADGTVPEGFEALARLAWENIKRQLVAAEMGAEIFDEAWLLEIESIAVA